MTDGGDPLPGPSEDSLGPRVLVAEADAFLAATLVDAFAREGWPCLVEASLEAARLRLQDGAAKVAVVDLDAALGEGLALLREAAGLPQTRLLALSSAADEVDRVVALEMGADDFVAKPFSARELVARVRALLRRLPSGATARAVVSPPPAAASGPSSGGWCLGSLVADPRRLRLMNAAGEEQRLTGAEAGLLELLLRAPGREATRAEISVTVLGRELLPLQRGVDQLACGLRRKLAELSGGAVELLPMRGRGYRLID
jgi:DNA-binding response OmpR family regulator